MPIEITAATSASPELLEALARLVPQLSDSAPQPTLEDVRRIVEGDATTLFLATDDDGEILGTLTLAVFAIPTGIRAWIEDVVVDERARGRGVARSLTLNALELARTKGAAGVDLTSRPSRVAANRLYEALGFERRETNVYRFPLIRGVDTR